MEDINLYEIDGRPTKELFISMLVKDITLNDAIGDLIDNSVDGALSIRTEKNFSNLTINITLNDDFFIIEDNCGGIKYETAKNYAFRFGRTVNTPSQKGSVGRFGIGMKRALFKMGKEFHITSKSARSSFSVDVDVDKWEIDTDSWNFQFTQLEILDEKEEDFPEAVRGTKIIVSKLNEDVKERFKLDAFVSDLIEEIRLEHLANINNQLKIVINDVELESHDLIINFSDELKPSYWEKIFPNGLKTKILVGIGESDLQYGGWYLFCNDRLIKGPEQTIDSGWGARKPIRMPKYHNQYDRFRGFVYFESDDTSLLPWNTSKNNMDVDSPLYRSIRQEMITSMRPVIDFLNKIHDERKVDNPLNRPLNSLLEKIQNNSVNVAALLNNTEKLPSSFSYPTQIQEKIVSSEIFISFSRPKDKVDHAMKILNVKSPTEVGELAFDYFYENECED